MAMIDIGDGKFRDLDTDRQFIDVIAEKISPEFADIIRERIENADKDYRDLENDRDRLDDLTDEYIEVFQRVEKLTRNFSIQIDMLQRIHRKTVLNMLEEIKNEVKVYT